MAARTKACVCDRLFAGIVTSIPAEHKRLSLVSVVYCQIEISVSDSQFSRGVLLSVMCLISVIVTP